MALTIKRRWAVGAAALAVAAATLAPVSAYPPGQAMVLTASASQVAPGTIISLKVTKAKPGVATVKFGRTVKRTAIGSSYSSVALLTRPRAAGIYIATAKAADGETATTRVYVPSARLPYTARVGAVASAVIRYAKPGSAVVVTVGNETYVGQVSNAGTAVVPFTLETTGRQLVEVSVAGLALNSNYVTGR